MRKLPYRGRMTYLILISAASLLVLVVLLWAAPRGWQDEAGFHYGEKPHRPLAAPRRSTGESPSDDASRAAGPAEPAAAARELAAAE